MLGRAASPDGYAGYFVGHRNYFEGMVGIGTTDPGYQLHVATDDEIALYAESTDTLSADVFSVFGAARSGAGKVGVLGRQGPGSGYYAGDTGGGVIGDSDQFIGVTGVTSGTGPKAIGVYGASFTQSGLNYGVYGENHSPNGIAGYFEVPGGGGIAVVATSPGVAIYADGLVGIKESNPQFTLHCNGSAAKPEGGEWSTISDRRLKKNIRPLEGALDRLLQLQGVTFEFKDPETIDELPGTQIGFIAQEVEPVFPDWVSEGPSGYKNLSIRGATALTVDALRELRQEKDAQIAELQEENAELRDRLAVLEAFVHALAARQSGGVR